MKINHKWLLLTTGVVVVAIAVGMVWIKSSTLPKTRSDESTVAKKQVSTPSVPKVIGTMITSARSNYGDILWGPNSQAIYIWEREPSVTPKCYDDCAVAWPPVLTNGEPQAGAGVDVTLLGTTQRSDGTIQVTYNGHPLYYYAHEGPGEVKCHNVATHGGLWWVVTTGGARGP